MLANPVNALTPYSNSLFKTSTMRFVLLLFLFFAVQIPSAKAQVTYSKDIAPIIYNNCTSCHRPGEIGPMPLTNFEEVSSWSGMIEYVTAIKYMPPWKPNKEYSNFVGERGLTDSEIELIADWVAAGSPQGDPALEPPLPDFPDGSQLGTPDLILEMEEEYFIEGNNQDDYRVFVIPTGLTEDKEIAAVEFRPGNTNILPGFLPSNSRRELAQPYRLEQICYCRCIMLPSPLIRRINR